MVWSRQHVFVQISENINDTQAATGQDKVREGNLNILLDVGAGSYVNRSLLVLWFGQTDNVC